MVGALRPADRALVDFAVKLTRHPRGIAAVDLDRLRRHGFADPAIHLAVQITGFFNYYNRLVDGLGVALEPEWDAARSPLVGRAER